MTNMLIVGCGGIGSFFIRELYQLYENGVDGTEKLDITMVDGDEVEEKNLRYQNFMIEDLGKFKAHALGERYPFQMGTKYIETEKELKGFDIIIIAVDNGKLRNLVYEYCDKNKDVYFIDMRSEGRGVVCYTTHKKNTLEKLKSTIDVDKPSTSCQIKFELDNGIIQVGNRIIAMIGIQLLLNKLRGVKNSDEYIQRF